MNLNEPLWENFECPWEELMGLWAFSLNIYSERASLCIIYEYINLLLFSPHKRMGFPAPHTQKRIHIHTDLHNQSLVLHVRLYSWFNNTDDITLWWYNTIMSLSQTAMFLLFFRCTYPELHSACIWFWSTSLTIFTLRCDRSCFVKWHWPIYSHVCCRDTHGRTNPDMSPSATCECCVSAHESWCFLESLDSQTAFFWLHTWLLCCKYETAAFTTADITIMKCEFLRNCVIFSDINENRQQVSHLTSPKD